MRNDFCIFILTHGRPDRVYTYTTLLGAGYTGKVFIIIDDEDDTADEYRKRYGDKVLMFCKKDVAANIDEGDNFNDRRAIIYARNACWDLAREVGCRYFMQLDDDYLSFVYRLTSAGQIVGDKMDAILAEMIEYFRSIPALSIAMSQGGDHMGSSAPLSLRRKAMNSFLCDTRRPFQFTGRINEDVNTYTSLSRAGHLFFTILPIQLNQAITQTNSGGMTELYRDGGTYIKSFYSVMYCPSSVLVGFLKDPRHSFGRIHHQINWNTTAPKILSEQYKKTTIHGKTKNQ